MPGEKAVPSIKVDALKLLGLLLRAELMMTAVDRRRYANRAIDAIMDVIRDFQIAHDFEDERPAYLRKLWGDVAVFIDLMRIIGETNASVFDAQAGIALNGHFMKLIAWYDNEYGFTCNMLRLLAHIASVKG